MSYCGSSTSFQSLTKKAGTLDGITYWSPSNDFIGIMDYNFQRVEKKPVVGRSYTRPTSSLYNAIFVHAEKMSAARYI